LKFLKKNDVNEDYIVAKIKLALRKLRGENVNINIKKLKGEWSGFYRIKAGKLRIIVEFLFHKNIAYIERIDWRGNVYK
jgi:mRNA-degrading endonuclease RelE of RelBE toxin-antitoxin system